VKEELIEKRVAFVIIIVVCVCAVNLGRSKGDLKRREEEIDEGKVDPD
jgi:hypothetical protein